MGIQELRVVAFQEEGLWIAQCLEFDIAAQGKDLKELQEILSLTIEADFNESMKRHGKPFAGLDPAPARFFEMWDHCAGTLTPHRPAPGAESIPKIELALCA